MVISRRVPLELAAGNCVRIDGGTVKVCAPAVVVQMNETEVVTPAGNRTGASDDLQLVRRVSARPVECQSLAPDDGGLADPR